MATDTGAPATRLDKSPRTATDRLPVAPRQRRPALAALALLLILGGGLISAVLVVRSGQKEAVIALRQDVPRGHVITDADLVSLPAALPDGYPAVPWAQRGRVVGGTAGADLKKGTILNPRVVAKDPLPAPSQVGTGIDLKPDQIPPGLQAGQHVTVIFALPPQATSNTVLPRGFKEPEHAVLVKDAVVFSVSRPRSDQTVSVKLILKEGADARIVVQLARQSAIALLELPAGP